MALNEALVSFFEAGGFFMFPIALVCTVGTLIAIERMATLSLMALRGKRTWRNVQAMLDEGRVDAIAEYQDARCAVAQMLRGGLKRLGSGRRRDDLDRAMEQSLNEILPRLERNTQYLTKFANVAILIGLLGTLIAFAGVFAGVSQAHPSDQAELMAAGIAASINPAAFGLIVAIPLLLIHTFLQTLSTDLLDHFDVVAAEFSDRFSAIRARQSVADSDPETTGPTLQVVDAA